MKLRSSDTGRKYGASRCPRVTTRAATAQTIKSAAMPPVRISRFFCAVIKSPARMAFYKAYHMKETIAGIALFACSGPQHMVL